MVDLHAHRGGCHQSINAAPSTSNLQAGLALTDDAAKRAATAASDQLADGRSSTGEEGKGQAGVSRNL